MEKSPRLFTFGDAAEMLSWGLAVFDFILRPVAWLFCLDQDVPVELDLIDGVLLPSYASTPGGLTDASMRTTRLANEVARDFPDCVVIGGEFVNNPKGSMEWERKLTILPKKRCVNIGLVSSTVDEVQAMAAKMKPCGTYVIIGDGIHTRRARAVWKYYLPYAKLIFRSIKPIHPADRANPMVFQRYWRDWLLFNLVFLPLFKWSPGVGFFATHNLSQPVSK